MMRFRRLSPWLIIDGDEFVDFHVKQKFFAVKKYLDKVKLR